MDSDLYKRALDYHTHPKRGKVETVPTKAVATQHDLSLAYSPGVAAPCLEIKKDPSKAYSYTSKGNLVAVVSNGSAVLGLGNIGALAGKPVMEGKGVLFKKFAGIDVFDIEVNETDPKKLIDIVVSLEPTFGGINLEDIKAPECFEIERECKERMNIPVFHDDQHGTAIITAAAILNWLILVGRKIEEVKMSVSGAGASAIACLNLLVSLGMRRENIRVFDSKGLVHSGRTDIGEFKRVYATNGSNQSLESTLEGCDIFLGLSRGNVLSGEMLLRMSDNPLILALANPEPEILPEIAKKFRSDVIICTGRSDYPNQVNNVLCFPFIFRGALDCGATSINEEMKLACVRAIADLAREESPTGDEEMTFGPEYLIPKPLDNRLITRIAPAVAEAAMRSGVAREPIDDFERYTEELTQFVFKSTFFMRPTFHKVSKSPIKARIAFAEGEDNRILLAAHGLIRDKMVYPILIGRPKVIYERLKRLNLELKPGSFEIVNNESDDRFKEYWSAYYQLNKRSGVSVESAKRAITNRMTVIGALMLHLGQAEGLICGVFGSYYRHLEQILTVLNFSEDSHCAASMTALIMPDRNVFIADTDINIDPSAEDIMNITFLATAAVKRFGMVPKVALVAASNYGSSKSESSLKMKRALSLIRERDPSLEIDGEMNAVCALDEDTRNSLIDDSPLKGSANLLIMPNTDSANISAHMLRAAMGSNCVRLGPMTIGLSHPVSIMYATSSVRNIFNVATVLACQYLSEKES